MTPDEAFNFGFLFKCAEDGFPPELADQALTLVRSQPVKQAWVEKAFQVAALPAAAAGVLTATGLASGAMIGHRNKKRELETVLDPADVQHQELLDAYRMHTQKILREMADDGQLPKIAPDQVRKLRAAQAARRPALAAK